MLATARTNNPTRQRLEEVLAELEGVTHASIPASQRAALGLSDTLIRLSPGIEHADDLVHDLLEGVGAVSASAHREEREAVAPR